MKLSILLGAWILAVCLMPFAANSNETRKVPVLTLAQAHDLAIQNHPGLKDVGESIRQAEIMRFRAWGILMPRLDADGTITRNDKEISFEMQDIGGMIEAAVAEALGNQPPAVGEGTSAVLQGLWGQRYGITANITLFNARSIPLIENAYDGVEIARLQGRVARDDLLFAVTVTYYGIKSSEKMVDNAGDNLDTSREFLRLAKARLAVGSAVKVDVLQAELAVTEAEKQLQDARDSLRVAKAGLAYLTGIDNDFRVTDPPAPQAPGEQLDVLQKKALHDRADLQAMRVQILIADRSKIDTWVKWIPTFDLTYNYAWDSASGFADTHTSWRLIFGAKWSLIDSGQRIAELYERDSQIRQAGFRYEQLVLTIKEEVEKVLVEWRQGERNLKLAEKNLALARENHRLFTKQYQGGLASGLELFNATNTLNRARHGRVLEELKKDLAILKLSKAVGSNPR